MARILEATADASGKVTAGEVLVEDAVVQSEGKQESSGLLILEGEKAYYIPSSATDIKTLIEKLISVIENAADALTKTATTFTAVAGGMTGPTTAPPPALPTNVADITAKVTSLNAVKSELNTLKGALK